MSSPLTRTLETAVGVFANEAWRNNGHGAPLMAEQTEEQASRLWHVLCSSLLDSGSTLCPHLPLIHDRPLHETRNLVDSMQLIVASQETFVANQFRCTVKSRTVSITRLAFN